MTIIVERERLMKSLFTSRVQVGVSGRKYAFCAVPLENFLIGRSKHASSGALPFGSSVGAGEGKSWYKV